MLLRFSGRAALTALLVLGAGLAGCSDDGEGESPTQVEPEPTAECPATAAQVQVAYPPENGVHTASFIEIEGTSTNAESVTISVNGGPPIVAAGTANWVTTVQLTEGLHELRVTPIARADCPAGSTVTRTVVQGSDFTLMEPPPLGEVELRLDRLALERLLTPEDQEAIVLTRLDLRALVGNALAALEDPVAWGMDTSEWTPAQYNLASLLVMSPDSADLSDTVLAPVMDLSGQLGLPPPRILSDMLGLAPSQRFLSREVVTQVMIDQLIRTHPNFGDDPDGRMVVTLADGLGDLAPLYEKYREVPGVHPGFLAGPPSAELFTPSFAMIVKGTGNVVVRPGLIPGVGYSSHVEAPPPDEAILELNFSDPETFRIEGLHPEPRAALTLEVFESPRQFAIGELDPPPTGQPWDSRQATQLEYIIAKASREAFEPLWPDGLELSYDLGAISPAAEVFWDDGLVEVRVVADLGPPPPTAYIWDLILDVAQQRLHDGELAEGQANVLLALPLLPIGLDAEGLIDSMRPVLEAQKETMVGMMVGTVDALPSDATLWLDSGPSLRVRPGATQLYPSFDEMERDVDGIDRVELGTGSYTFWTRSPDGEAVVLTISPWTVVGGRGQVVIGQARIPEE